MTPSNATIWGSAFRPGRTGLFVPAWLPPAPPGAAGLPAVPPSPLEPPAPPAPPRAPVPAAPPIAAPPVPRPPVPAPPAAVPPVPRPPLPLARRPPVPTTPPLAAPPAPRPVPPESPDPPVPALAPPLPAGSGGAPPLPVASGRPDGQPMEAISSRAPRPSFAGPYRQGWDARRLVRRTAARGPWLMLSRIVGRGEALSGNRHPRRPLHQSGVMSGAHLGMKQRSAPEGTRRDGQAAWSGIPALKPQDDHVVLDRRRRGARRGAG